PAPREQLRGDLSDWLGDLAKAGIRIEDELELGHGLSGASRCPNFIILTRASGRASERLSLTSSRRCGSVSSFPQRGLERGSFQMAAPATSKLVERAREAAKKKNYDYAVELFLEHLKVAPGDVEARKELRKVERERFTVNPPGMLQRAKNATMKRSR